MDVEVLRTRGFWESAEGFVAGEWVGAVPEVGGVGGWVMFRTSGTTGEGKWVVVEKGALQVSARAVNEWLEVGEGAVWGVALPLNHVGGFGIIARSYAAGCGLEVMPGRWDAGEFTKWVAEGGVTHTSLVPTQVYDLVRGAVSAPCCVAAVVVGGGRLDDGLGQAARDLGWPVLASYGMTEACSQVATQRISALGRPFGEVGMELLPIWEARVNAEGMLAIMGEALFSGTVSGGTFSRRREGAYVTRDRVQLEGRFLVPEGRADSLIKVMGELIDVEEVERDFIRLAGGGVDPRKFAVVAVPDERRGHVLVAVFEGGLGAAESALREYQEKAGGLMRLGRWLELEEFPRSELGKLRRGELARMVQAGGECSEG